MTISSKNDWRTVLVERIRVEAQPPEKFSHQARLYAVARDIADASAEAVDDDVLFGSAWVHDLGVFVGHRPTDAEALRQWDSTAYTVAHAGAVLEQCGFPVAKIAAVLECIRTHEPHGEPSTVEGVIVRDADLLEQIGAVAVMRTTAKIAQDTRFVTFADAVRSLERALATVPGALQTHHGRVLAEPRTAVLRAFLDALQWESQGELA
ncbi:MAG: HD domain-containing protein [Janthinobacterium lividum]